MVVSYFSFFNVNFICSLMLKKRFIKSVLLYLFGAFENGFNEELKETYLLDLLKLALCYGNSGISTRYYQADFLQAF